MTTKGFFIKDTGKYLFSMTKTSSNNIKNNYPLLYENKNVRFIYLVANSKLHHYLPYVEFKLSRQITNEQYQYLELIPQKIRYYVENESNLQLNEVVEDATLQELLGGLNRFYMMISRKNEANLNGLNYNELNKTNEELTKTGFIVSDLTSSYYLVASAGKEVLVKDISIKKNNQNFTYSSQSQSKDNKSFTYPSQSQSQSQSKDNKSFTYPPLQSKVNNYRQPPYYKNNQNLQSKDNNLNFRLNSYINGQQLPN